MIKGGPSIIIDSLHATVTTFLTHKCFFLLATISCRQTCTSKIVNLLMFYLGLGMCIFLIIQNWQQDEKICFQFFVGNEISNSVYSSILPYLLS